MGPISRPESSEVPAARRCLNRLRSNPSRANRPLHEIDASSLATAGHLHGSRYLNPSRRCRRSSAGILWSRDAALRGRRLRLTVVRSGEKFRPCESFAARVCRHPAHRCSGGLPHRPRWRKCARPWRADRRNPAGVPGGTRDCFAAEGAPHFAADGPDARETGGRPGRRSRHRMKTIPGLSTGVTNSPGKSLVFRREERKSAPIWRAARLVRSRRLPASGLPFGRVSENRCRLWRRGARPAERGRGPIQRTPPERLIWRLFSGLSCAGWKFAWGRGPSSEKVYRR